MSVPTEEVSVTGDQSASATDEDIRAAIERLTAELGKTPGRERVRSAVPGIGASRADRVLRAWRNENQGAETTRPAESDPSATAVLPPITSNAGGELPAVYPEVDLRENAERQEQAEHQDQVNGDRAEPSVSEAPLSPTSDRADRAEQAKPTGQQADSDRSGELGQWSALGRRMIERRMTADRSAAPKQTRPVGRSMPTFLWVISGLVMLPALLAIWSGWISLGLAVGWESVPLLPSIADIEINAVVFIPFSVEVLTVVSLGFFLHYRGRAIRWVSGLTALVMTGLGLFGQAWAHYLQSSTTPAPPWLTVFVSSLPVLAMTTTGLLVHLARNEHAQQDGEQQA